MDQNSDIRRIKKKKLGDLLEWAFDEESEDQKDKPENPNDSTKNQDPPGENSQ